jgi:DNA-binding response OmpR family regulator
MQKEIILVEDVTEIREGLKLSLEKDGYQVYSFSNGEEALEFLENTTVNLILLDLMLPGINGNEFMHHLRANSSIPVIVISALGDEFTQINLFNQQIDDFITKPFSPNILSLKIDAVLRRCKKFDEELLTYKNITLEINNYKVYKDNQLIEITTKEFDILQAMLLNQGKVYSREELMEALWEDCYLIDLRTIDVHIKNIRNKLGKDIIRTVKGIGYRIEKAN